MLDACMEFSNLLHVQFWLSIFFCIAIEWLWLSVFKTMIKSSIYNGISSKIRLSAFSNCTACTSRCLYLILLWLLIQFYITNLCVVGLKYFPLVRWRKYVYSFKETERQSESENRPSALALQSLTNDGSNIFKDQSPPKDMHIVQHCLLAKWQLPTTNWRTNFEHTKHAHLRLICSPHRCHRQNQTKTI